MKNGMRGGLCTIMRTCAGSEVDRSFYPPSSSSSRFPHLEKRERATDEERRFSINSHLFPPEEETELYPADYLSYFDLGSLYAFSGKSK